MRGCVRTLYTAVAGREGKARVIGGGCVGAAGRLWRSEYGPEGYFLNSDLIFTVSSGNFFKQYTYNFQQPCATCNQLFLMWYYRENVSIVLFSKIISFRTVIQLAFASHNLIIGVCQHVAKKKCSFSEGFSNFFQFWLSAYGSDQDGKTKE